MLLWFRLEYFCALVDCLGLKLCYRGLCRGWIILRLVCGVVLCCLCCCNGWLFGVRAYLSGVAGWIFVFVGWGKVVLLACGDVIVFMFQDYVTYVVWFLISCR